MRNNKKPQKKLKQKLKPRSQNQQKDLTEPQARILHPEAKVTLESDHFEIFAFKNVIVKANSSIIIPLGIKVDLPPNHYIMYINIADRVYPHEIYIHPAMIYVFPSNAAEDYTILKNDSDKDYVIKAGEVLVCGVILRAKFKLPKVVDLK